MPNAQRIADLCMLELTDTEENALRADIKKILIMDRKMSKEHFGAVSSSAVSADALRPDEAMPYHDAVSILSLSGKERDGDITVPRTVGGTV